MCQLTSYGLVMLIQWGEDSLKQMSGLSGHPDVAGKERGTVFVL